MICNTITKSLKAGKNSRRLFSTATKRSSSPSQQGVTKRDFKSSPRLCEAEIGAMNTLTEGTNVWLPKTCGFIGGGNMADALLQGFLEKKAFLKQNICIADILPERLSFMKDKYGTNTTKDNRELTKQL